MSRPRPHHFISRSSPTHVNETGSHNVGVAKLLPSARALNHCHPERSASPALRDERVVEGSRQCVRCDAGSGSSPRKFSPSLLTAGQFECAAPTALEIIFNTIPALTCWANFWRASGPRSLSAPPVSTLAEVLRIVELQRDGSVGQRRAGPNQRHATGDSKSLPHHAQHRRCVKKLAQGVSPGKSFNKNASPSGAAQNCGAPEP